MITPTHLAQQFKQVCYGGNWTCSSLKEHLAGVSHEQALKKVEGFNTIAQLAYHIHYFVAAVTPVLATGAILDAHDKYSFDHPDFKNQQEWDAFVSLVFETGDTFIAAVEKLPASKLDAFFVEEKYGTYYRNIQGIIEHTHYHLGQLVLVKKMVSFS